MRFLCVNTFVECKMTGCIPCANAPSFSLIAMCNALLELSLWNFVRKLTVCVATLFYDILFVSHQLKMWQR
jgi:hypothetical protein